MQAAPVKTARRDASIVARSASPADFSAMAAAIIAASAESGPSTMMREGPNAA